MQNRKRAKYILLSLLAGLATSVARADLITNGGFESGFTGWTVINQTGSTSGSTWFIQTGTTSPVSGQNVPAPPGGTHAAMTDENGASSMALLQSFTVAPASTVTLSFDLFVSNLAVVSTPPGFFTPNTLDFNTIPNQQARVDILTAGAGAFDLGTSVIDNVLTPTANSTAYVHYSFDLTNAVGGGGTFQLRFAEADNVNIFNLGVDNVSIQTSSAAVPEPATGLLAAAILLALIAIRKAGRGARLPEQRQVS